MTSTLGYVCPELDSAVPMRVSYIILGYPVSIRGRALALHKA